MGVCLSLIALNEPGVLKISFSYKEEFFSKNVKGKSTVCSAYNAWFENVCSNAIKITGKLLIIKAILLYNSWTQKTVEPSHAEYITHTPQTPTSLLSQLCVLSHMNTFSDFTSCKPFLYPLSQVNSHIFYSVHGLLNHLTCVTATVFGTVLLVSYFF